MLNFSWMLSKCSNALEIWGFCNQRDAFFEGWIHIRLLRIIAARQVLGARMCQRFAVQKTSKNTHYISLHLITSHYPNENSSLCHHSQLVQLVLCWSFSFTCTHCAECSHASREPWKQKTNTRTYLYCMCMHIFIYKVIIHIYNIYI